VTERSQPKDCPKAPLSNPSPCSILSIETGAQLVSRINQCSRCGWVDPVYLDAYAELGYKRRLNKIEQRTAMAISGEPFTFVRSSESDVTLDEALGQALGAASMCWERPEDAGTFDMARAKQIFEQLKKLLVEKARAERRSLVEEIGRNFH
jgi:hypothetical protein